MNLDKFSSSIRGKGNYRVLIATDVLSRGVHIQGLTHCLQFDTNPLPKQSQQHHRHNQRGRNHDRNSTLDTFVHRSGRVGRSQIGCTITLLSSHSAGDLKLAIDLCSRLSHISAVTDDEAQNVTPTTTNEFSTGEIVDDQRHLHLPLSSLRQIESENWQDPMTMTTSIRSVTLQQWCRLNLVPKITEQVQSVPLLRSRASWCDLSMFTLLPMSMLEFVCAKPEFTWKSCVSSGPLGQVGGQQQSESSGRISVDDFLSSIDDATTITPSQESYSQQQPQQPLSEGALAVQRAMLRFNNPAASTLVAASSPTSVAPTTPSIAQPAIQTSDRLRALRDEFASSFRKANN